MGDECIFGEFFRGEHGGGHGVMERYELFYTMKITDFWIDLP